MTTWTRYRETSPLCDFCLHKNVIFLSAKPENDQMPTRFICENCVRTIKDFYINSYLEKEDKEVSKIRTAEFELSPDNRIEEFTNWNLKANIHGDSKNESQ